MRFSMEILPLSSILPSSINWSNGVENAREEKMHCKENVVRDNNVQTGERKFHCARLCAIYYNYLREIHGLYCYLLFTKNTRLVCSEKYFFLTI